MIGWWALWLPLVNDLAALRADAPRSRAALADAQRMADEIAGLARRHRPRPQPIRARCSNARLPPPTCAPPSRSSTGRTGRARVVFAAVDFARLVAALEALQRESGLAIVDATLTARVEPGTVRAELVLAR